MERSREPSNDCGRRNSIRGDVTWNTDNLGDFVLLRSKGLPVYNFCVAIDDCHGEQHPKTSWCTESHIQFFYIGWNEYL